MHKVLNLLNKMIEILEENQKKLSSRKKQETKTQILLIKHPDFALPGRKALLKSDMEYEVVLIDATETPIERPKKE